MHHGMKEIQGLVLKGQDFLQREIIVEGLQITDRVEIQPNLAQNTRYRLIR